jgi:hypothetical protein
MPAFRPPPFFFFFFFLATTSIIRQSCRSRGRRHGGHAARVRALV